MVQRYRDFKTVDAFIDYSARWLWEQGVYTYSDTNDPDEDIRYERLWYPDEIRGLAKHNYDTFEDDVFEFVAQQCIREGFRIALPGDDCDEGAQIWARGERWVRLAVPQKVFTTNYLIRHRAPEVRWTTLPWGVPTEELSEGDRLMEFFFGIKPAKH